MTPHQKLKLFLEAAGLSKALTATIVYEVLGNEEDIPLVKKTRKPRAKKQKEVMVADA